jgi:hypothetical protein
MLISAWFFDTNSFPADFLQTTSLAKSVYLSSRGPVLEVPVFLVGAMRKIDLANCTSEKAYVLFGSK